MEKKKLEKAEAQQIVTLQKEVQELKTALKTGQLREEIIANILLVRDEMTLQKILTAIGNVINPKRPGDKEQAVALQGNG